MSEIPITADIAGSIWKILKAPGDRVAEGDVIMIIESMKMEIPVTPSDSGVIKEIKVQEGDAVQEGAILATISAS